MRPKNSNRGPAATPYFTAPTRVASVCLLAAPTGTGQAPCLPRTWTIAVLMSSAPSDARCPTTSRPGRCLHAGAVLCAPALGQAQKENP
jgi:hypothetical protein